jgi:hypothetical protein
MATRSRTHPTELLAIRDRDAAVVEAAQHPHPERGAVDGSGLAQLVVERVRIRASLGREEQRGEDRVDVAWLLVAVRSHGGLSRMLGCDGARSVLLLIIDRLSKAAISPRPASSSISW